MPTTFANTIDENEILAKRSQCDYAGNDIQTTYATKSELPTATSDLTNDSGFITLSDVPTQVNADWNASSGVSEILNKPVIPSGSQLVPAATIADADKVLKVNSIGTPEWSTGGGGGSQVNSDWDATSGVAEILNKPDLVDIVAGPGIVIDNPDGNTLRVSTEADAETVLWEGTYSGTIGSSNYITLSESCANFEYIEITNGGAYKSTYRFSGSSTTLSFIQSFANTGGTTIYTNRYTVDNSVPKITCNCSNSFSVYANGINSWTNRGSMDVGETRLTKVVGIHRIANN